MCETSKKKFDERINELNASLAILRGQLLKLKRELYETNKGLIFLVVSYIVMWFILIAVVFKCNG